MKMKVNDITLDYTVSGKGKPLILLHGNGEDKEIFNKLIKKLERHYKIYAIDSRNHGKSSQTNDYSYEIMSQDIVCFIRELELKKPNILGFSDGAIIALYAILENNELFDHMILLGVNLNPNDFKKSNFEYLKNEFERSNNPMIKLMLTSPNIAVKDLFKITSRTLIVAAENELFYRKTYQKINQAIKNSKLVIMKNHTHDSYIVDNDVLFEEIVLFVGSDK